MCGASSEQKDTYKQQSQLFGQMKDQATQVFGKSTNVFTDLFDAFSPVVAAGPNQEGFSAAEKSALQSQAITQTGVSYENARKAVGERIAAQGGGNMALPSGASIGAEVELANAGAAQTAGQLGEIERADYATGRDNFFKASQGLNGSTEVFNPSTGAGNAATGAGSAAASTANEISQANNSWMTAVSGALGGVAGAVATGGMSNLGKGLTFFGGQK